MSTINYTLRVDEADKRDAETIFKELGMTLSTGINIYIKAVNRQKKIPFELAVGRSSVTARPFRSSLLDAPKIATDGHEVDRFMERKRLEKELEYSG